MRGESKDAAAGSQSENVCAERGGQRKGNARVRSLKNSSAANRANRGSGFTFAPVPARPSPATVLGGLAFLTAPANRLSVLIDLRIANATRHGQVAAKNRSNSSVVCYVRYSMFNEFAPVHLSGSIFLKEWTSHS